MHHARRRRNPWSLLLIELVTAAWLVLAGGPAAAAPIEFAQPFLMSFRRHEVQVIAFLSDHPEYDAVEAFIVRRPGREPIIRALITRRDGFQIDHINDPAVALEMAQTAPGRLVVQRPVSFQESTLPDGRPRIVLEFESYRGEAIRFELIAFSPPSTDFGGPIDPGNHDLESSLPVMWVDASTPGDPASTVVIDGAEQAILPGPFPGVVSAFYSTGFNIGVIYRGELEMTLVDGPSRLRVGRAWTFVDQIGREHRYEVTDLAGDEVVIRKTTLNEEVIVARRGGGRGDVLEIVSVRLTGARAPMSAAMSAGGFTLDLSEPGRFSLSIDDHAGLVTGTATASYEDDAVTWVLAPTEPAWATPRVVNATACFDPRGDARIVNTIGE